MKKLILFLSIITIIFSSRIGVAQKSEIKQLSTDFYELYLPDTTDAVLILFGGFPESGKDIKREFGIHELANQNKIAVAYLNYSQKLWLEEEEQIELAESIKELFNSNNLSTKKVFFGGFSSGGNMALLSSDFLIEKSNNIIEPTGVFIVDSPIDLVGLYKSAEKNIERNSSEPWSQEAKWIIATLEENFGKPENNLTEYEQYAVYTSSTNNIQNLKNLKNTRIRFYTEPDTLWWKEHRKADYDQMNAYYIKILSESLKNSGFNKVEYITTDNKGYRANGSRHPHSWSIVNKDDLIQWILE